MVVGRRCVSKGRKEAQFRSNWSISQQDLYSRLRRSDPMNRIRNRFTTRRTIQIRYALLFSRWRCRLLLCIQYTRRRRLSLGCFMSCADSGWNESLPRHVDTVPLRRLLEASIVPTLRRSWSGGVLGRFVGCRQLLELPPW
jgi:hypothetical protein